MFSAEQLLNPISAEQPCGADLAFTPEIDAIRRAREADDPSLDQGAWVTDLKEADWDFVIKRCAALLEQKSKDLQLAVWLTEAAARKHGMRGLGEGLRLLAGLFTQFWDQGLYPEADDGDHARRSGNLGWVLGRIPALLRAMPVTEGAPYSSIDFETARKNPEHPVLKLAAMDNARRANSIAFRTDFNADARYCMDALLQLEKAADDKLGADSPGFSNSRDAVQTMMHLIPAPIATPGQEYDNIVNDQGMPHMEAPAGQGPVATRAQAIAQLRAVAEFFRRTEPHSPVSYFADKAANAAEQDLHTWLRSVVKDDISLAHIEELLGVKRGD